MVISTKTHTKQQHKNVINNAKLTLWWPENNIKFIKPFIKIISLCKSIFLSSDYYNIIAISQYMAGQAKHFCLQPLFVIFSTAEVLNTNWIMMQH